MNPSKPDNVLEYKLRVPRNLVKNYYVMKLNSPRPVNFNDVHDASLSRRNPREAEEERPVSPVSGAGSQFGKDKKEETKRRRRGHGSKEISSEDMLYSLHLSGKKDKKFSGKKEGTILDNSSYYILTQCPDGVFEAMPIQAWYNFKSNIDYHVLSSDDVEKEFSRRDKTINYHNMMVQKRLQAMEEKEDEQVSGEKVKRTYRDDLMIHDDEDDDDDREEMTDEESEDEKKPKTAKGKKKETKAKKDIYGGKKKKKDNEDEDDFDSDEEEEFDNVESKEFDYMSESSSNDEEEGLQDEPEPETKKNVRAKDDLNAFSMSDSEEEEVEDELTTVGKELKEMLKREAGDESSLDEDEDEDIDESEKYSKSALFMPGNENKKRRSGKSGSVSGSNSSSRSATPTPMGDSSRPGTPQSGKKSAQSNSKKPPPNRQTPTLPSSSYNKDSSSSRKRPSSRQSQESNSPPNKKEKLQQLAQDKTQLNKPADINSQKFSQKDQESKEPLAITESTIRRYLAHKPMTTTDLVKKFKTKKTGLSKEQTVSTIASILKKIGPERQTIDGKLYLSIKPSKK